MIRNFNTISAWFGGCVKIKFQMFEEWLIYWECWLFYCRLTKFYFDYKCQNYWKIRWVRWNAWFMGIWEIFLLKFDDFRSFLMIKFWKEWLKMGILSNTLSKWFCVKFCYFFDSELKFIVNVWVEQIGHFRYNWIIEIM